MPPQCGLLSARNAVNSRTLNENTALSGARSRGNGWPKPRLCNAPARQVLSNLKCDQAGWPYSRNFKCPVISWAVMKIIQGRYLNIGFVCVPLPASFAVKFRLFRPIWLESKPFILSWICSPFHSTVKPPYLSDDGQIRVISNRSRFHRVRRLQRRQALPRRHLPSFD